ncbi:rod shape-determining protein [Pontibacter flavimaris]|uniref:Cell shape-determining protein MreB n=1 Tax=Pontibacter flavimaris TaxID=1797110 RepID=A0A1Q5P8W1_9BACT|nr:rod shape-determining protein [Pontibacter flavimaris]OKL38667.1 rod shape-determining protein [Pontibacter flavimaris]
MSFFNFRTQGIAIDLGTANFLMIFEDRVVVDEPAVIAFNRTTGATIAVGRKAEQMEGKEHENIRIIRPLKNGVIADFHAAEHMMRGMLKLANNGKGMFSPSYRMLICVPSGITEVEKRAIRDSAMIAGAKDVYLVHEPVAAAIGIGLDVQDATGHMIVDIGGGTTEIAVIALSGIVCDQSIRVAGDNFNADIIHHVRRQHNIHIGASMAEKIKLEVGAALPELQDPPLDFAIKGRDLMSGLPKQVMVSYQEVAYYLDKSITKIEEAILKTLEITPPELSSDIHHSGIFLTGGGALLRGLDKRIASRTKLPVHVADEPLLSVVKGTAIALKKIDEFRFLMR